MKKNIPIKNIAIFATLMFTQPGISALHEAIENNDITEVEILLREGVSIGKLNEYRATPLHEAALRGNKAVVKLLIEKHANIHARNEDGETPLHKAAENGKITIVDTLLEAGADLEALTQRNNTPLCYATETGYKDIVRKLLKAGASIQQGSILKRALNAHEDNKLLLQTYGPQAYQRNVSDEGVDSIKTVKLILLMENSYWEDSLSSQAQVLLQNYKFDLGSFGPYLRKSKKLGKQRYRIIESAFDGSGIPTVLIQLIVTYYDSFDGRKLLIIEEQERLIKECVKTLEERCNLPTTLIQLIVGYYDSFDKQEYLTHL